MTVCDGHRDNRAVTGIIGCEGRRDSGCQASTEGSTHTWEPILGEIVKRRGPLLYTQNTRTKRTEAGHLTSQVSGSIKTKQKKHLEHLGVLHPNHSRHPQHLIFACFFLSFFLSLTHHLFISPQMMREVVCILPR